MYSVSGPKANPGRSPRISSHKLPGAKVRNVSSPLTVDRQQHLSLTSTSVSKLASFLCALIY